MMEKNLQEFQDGQQMLEPTYNIIKGLTANVDGYYQSDAYAGR